MVAVIGKNKTAVLHILFKVGPLLFIKLHQLMPAEVTKGAEKISLLLQRDHFFFSIDGDGGVFQQRVEYI